LKTAGLQSADIAAASNSGKVFFCLLKIDSQWLMSTKTMTPDDMQLLFFFCFDDAIYRDMPLLN